MTPTLGIPSINRPDLLAACIASIDIPVRLVVIDNSSDGSMRAVTPDDAVYVACPWNMGVAASWNLIIRSAPADPYWLIANADTVFGPGDLAALRAEMEIGGPRWVGMNGDWRVFGISAETVDAIGFFDEGYHPCYFEDADYERRASLGGVPWYFISGSAGHVGSAAIASDPTMQSRNAVTFPRNSARFEQKWGGSARGGERYATPWDRGGPLSDWTLERRTLADNAWS